MKKASVAVILASFLVFFSCEAMSPNQSLKTNLPVFDLDLFEQNLIDRVTWLDEPCGLGLYH
jgi:hypothetical protein